MTDQIVGGYLQGEEIFHTLPAWPHLTNLSCHDWRYRGCVTPALWSSSQVLRDCWWIVTARLDLAIVEHWINEGIDIAAKEHKRRNGLEKLKHIVMAL